MEVSELEPEERFCLHAGRHTALTAFSHVPLLLKSPELNRQLSTSLSTDYLLFSESACCCG